MDFLLPLNMIECMNVFLNALCPSIECHSIQIAFTPHTQCSQDKVCDHCHADQDKVLTDDE